MKIYFACSSKKIESYLKEYSKIKNYILELDNSITFDWIDHVILKNDKSRKDIATTIIDKSKIYSETIDAILEADVLVADVSFASGSVGYQIAYALSQRKPVLCIYSTDFGMKKVPQVISSINSKLLTIDSYSRKNYKSVIKKYLNSNFKNELIKFNFVISKDILLYLDWLSEKEKRSKSQLLREKIVNLIIRNDNEYNIFLKNAHTVS